MKVKDWITATDLYNLIERGESIPVPQGREISNQWYHDNKSLQNAEIEAMAHIHPESKMGYFPDGKMAWVIKLCTGDLSREWIIVAIYDNYHPQRRWGGSVKFYPVKPNYEEMMEMVNHSSVTPKHIPHLLRDKDMQMYMSIPYMDNVLDDQHRGELVATAASCLRFVVRWIAAFESGLSDQIAWSKLHMSRGI